MKSLHEPIALMRPLLPHCDAIIPYLREIDVNRTYSNFGPLSLRLANRLAAFFGKAGYDSDNNPGNVVMVSNGTAGLTNILRALNLPRGTYCLLPSWTFIATPASAIAAGLVPYFLDVDEKNWALTPETVREQLRKLGSDASAVMVVAPFGVPLDTAEWDKLSEETGVPIIIDAAAAFDACAHIASAKPGKSPVMISLHATKAMGIGEGGVVISSNTRLISRVQEMSNFGFSGTRTIHTSGTNGKMSEYQAAVGLAALDDWPQRRLAWLRLKNLFVKAFKEAKLPVEGPCLEGDWVSSTMNIRLNNIPSQPIIDRLNHAGIESRQWWKGGCHLQPAYTMFPRGPLPVTEKLGNTVLALPFILDMTEAQIKQVVDTLGSILRGANDTNSV